MRMCARIVMTVVAMAAWCGAASAQPSSVVHVPGAAAFGQAVGVPQRDPVSPREGETVSIYFRVCCQFAYDRVAVYYTTTPVDPSGSFGAAGPDTIALTGGNPAGPVAFVANETVGGQTFDWWRATIPTAPYLRTVRYTISAWRVGNGPEVFATGGGGAGGSVYSYTTRLAWPGAGAGQASPGAGYPPVSFWKEEAVFGNTFTAGMIDQNGTVYDMHFPTPGGVFGVGTRNEGYVDGGDTFPALLPSGWRGQMHLNQAMPGIRVDGVTHWLSNPSGASYDQVGQQYHATSNSIRTTQRLFAGRNIQVDQQDFSPMGVAFPLNAAGQPERHIYIKRLTLTLPASAPGSVPVSVYWYVDPALNGGDGYDTMFWDGARGAMTAYDKTTRTVTGTGNSFAPPNEYNPTTSPGYTKSIALYLASCMKLAGTNTLASDSWRDSSSDNGQGWMGLKVILAPGVAQEVDVVMIGSSFRPANPLTDPMPANDGVYDNNIAPALEWFRTTSMASVQASTDAYWTDWLTGGTRASTPDAAINRMMDRGLLGTALHVDGFNGGVIAGFHNGAYPYVWARDAVYAAITLARTGHLAEAEGVYAFMKQTTYRDFEPWGRRGFWKQKYSADGYVIWGSPQIDETAVLPWGVWYQYRMTGDAAVLGRYVEQVRDAVESCTRSSSDARLYLAESGGGCDNDTAGLMHSNNVWEDSYATFVYSNANIVRGLRDAASVFDALGLNSERDDALGKAASVKAALDTRLACNAGGGENTDISLLGTVYPFDVYGPNDPLVTPLAARVQSRLLRPQTAINDGLGWTGLVDRYVGDSYWGNGSASSPWGAGPWFLSSVWYGLYLAERADVTPGKQDIDGHRDMLTRLVAHLGPVGFGAEQIAPRGIPSMGPPWNVGALLYPGQNDFVLEAAWPNAWESMSTFVDGVMAFLHYEPDGAHNTMAIEPKLPSAWGTMTFSNVLLQNGAGQTHRTTITLSETPISGDQTLTIVNTTGLPLTMRPTLKLLPGRSACRVLVNGVATAYTPDVTGQLAIQSFGLATGAATTTTLTVTTVAGSSPDWNHSGQVNVTDIFDFLSAWFAGSGDFNGVGGSTVQDIFDFLAAWFVAC